MPTPIYPSWNDKEFDLLKKMTENTALIADYEIGDVASVAGTAGNVLVNGGTAAATGAITLSLPSAIRVADGTLSAPVFSFSADSDTGLFRAASGSVAYASNGIRTFAFPTVTGSSGQFLTTDGAGNITWGTGSGTLPSQTGNAGKLLTTDGVNASWSSTLSGNLTVSGTTGITATDLILGTSGPSVKSTLSARAPRQGLVFDGTTGGSFTLTSAPSGSWSTDQTALIPTANPSSAIGLFAIGGTYSTDATIAMYISAGGALVVEQNTAAPSSFRTASISGFRSAYSGKTVRIATTVSSSTLTIYVNGVSASYSETTTGGSPPAWGATLGSATSYFGKLTASQYYFNSALGPLYIYNRALSASEVVALYEAGAPAGADYNNASSTNIITGDAWYTTVQSGTAISSGVATITTPGNLLGRATAVTVGKRYRVSVNITASTGGAVVRLFEITTGTNRVIGSAAGTNTLEFTATSADQYFNISAGTATFNTISLIPLGLLLAPDAAQAGGGLTWYDTSGNAANITLPASGVSWNVPTSGYVTSGSSLNLSAGGTNQNITLTPSGTGSVVANTASGASIFLQRAGTLIGSVVVAGVNEFALSAAAGKVTNLYANGYGAVALSIQANANVLVGGTIDGGQKLQVNGTAAISSTLTVGSGTNTFGVGGTTNQSTLVLNGGSSNGYGSRLELQRNGSAQSYIGTAGNILGSGDGAQSDTVIYANGSNQVRLYSGNAITLTLDSSQHFKLTPAVASSITTTQSAPQIRMGSRASGRSNVVLDSTAGRVWSLENTGTSLTVGYSGLDAITIAETTGDATFAGAVLSVGSGSNNAVCRVTASNGKTSDFGDDTTGGFVRANNSQSLRFITNSIAAITIDTSQDTTFAGQIVATKTTGAFRIATAETPASASATGTIGTIAWDTSYIYVCTAANTWKRVAIATW